MSAVTPPLPSPSTRALVPALAVRLAKLAQTVACDATARGVIPVHAPFTGEQLGEIPRGTSHDVDEAVRRSRAAGAAWAAVPVRARAEVLLRFHEALLARQEEILDIIQLEAGKARRHAFEEVADCANVARYYGCHALSLLRPRRRQGALPLLTRAVEHRHPHGVVGLVVPWNYPLNLLVTDALAALVAGNTVVAKPDHHTSFTALWAVELLRACGLPPEVLTVVTGDGVDLGPPLVDAVDCVMFTGSTATGRSVAARAATRLIPASLELGGKNVMVVRADADIDAAASGAVAGCFVGAGQVCVSIERICVARGIHDAFMERFVARTRALRLSADLTFDADVGSLGTARQLERVEAHVQDARAKGARVVAGGRARPDIGPLFYEPTILAGVRPGMLAFAEETFGPVVSVAPYDTDDEVVAAVNASEYGLNASVWSRDTAAAEALARRLAVGSVNVNEAYAATWGSAGAPMGGVKASGLGSRHGAEGLLKFTRSQTIATQRLLPLAAPSGSAAATHARLMTWALRVRRRLPGLR